MNRNIRLLLAASILIHSGINLLAPVFAIFLSTIQATLFETGIAVGIYNHRRIFRDDFGISHGVFADGALRSRIRRSCALRNR